jgi:hypothetical protein
MSEEMVRNIAFNQSVINALMINAGRNLSGIEAEDLMN